MCEDNTAVGSQCLVLLIARETLQIIHDVWPSHGDYLAAFPFQNKGDGMIVERMGEGRTPISVWLHVEMSVADRAYCAERHGRVTSWRRWCRTCKGLNNGVANPTTLHL